MIMKTRIIGSDACPDLFFRFFELFPVGDFFISNFLTPCRYPRAIDGIILDPPFSL